MITEKDIQDSLIKNLIAQGYAYSGHNINVDDIETIFKQEIERLNHTEYSETEFNRLLTNMNVDMAKAFTLLRYGVELIRDDNTTVTVKLFDTHDYRNNTFQVVDEVTIRGLRDRRLDIVILMNGLPVITFELKKPGNRHGLAEALKDINVYTNEGVYRAGLLKFIQLYVHSDEGHTRYQAASVATESGESYGSGFAWSDENNERINRLLPTATTPGFAGTFLKPDMVCDILWKYMLYIPEPQNTIMVLRPYQIYAIQHGEERLLTSNQNGFFWHATGSGKTLTSYVLTRTIAESDKFRKVVMLLDRNDLANQTIEEYNKFAGSKVANVVKSYELKNALVDPTQKTVITTIQSFNKVITKYKRTLKTVQKQPICFIIDECHRSTFGKMFKTINKRYQNAQFIGFTGTPILAENPNSDDLITKSIFGEPIHIYTIQDAIDDLNVLPFELKEVQINTTLPEGAKKDKGYYSNPTRLAEISDYIINNLYKHTDQKFEKKNPDQLVYYTAMLAASSISNAYAYWKALTPELAKQGRKTALIFSVKNKEEDNGNGTSYDWYLEALKAYDLSFNTNFSSLVSTEGVSEVRKKHLTDVMTRVKNREIDLVIVSDMLLTGFDAQTLNTIYLDKPLIYHNLVQAMSRTNRCHFPSKKTAGNVVIFSDRDMQNDVDDAIMLYANSNNVQGVVHRRDYKLLYIELTTQVKELLDAYPTSDSIDKIYDLSDLVEVAHLYSKINSNLKKIQTYDEWDNKDWNKIGISLNEMAYYSNAILNKRDHLEQTSKKVDETLWDELSFAIDSIRTTTINVAYINELLRNAILAPEREKRKWFNQVERALDLTNDPEVEKRKEALRRTIAQKDRISTEEELWKIYGEERAKLVESEFGETANMVGLQKEDIKKLLRLYLNTEVFPEDEANSMLTQLGLGIKEKRTTKATLRTELDRLVSRV